MAIISQLIGRWFQLAGPVDIGRMRPGHLAVESSICADQSQWEPTGSPKRNGNHAARSRHTLSGRWVQVSYALIDLFLVCLDGLIAYAFRFLPKSLAALVHWNRFALGSEFSTGRYLSFLLLDAAIVLLFCQSQDLYRTVRSRTAIDESFAVAKAISLATLLLSAFIYLSGVKIVSRLVVVYAGALNITTFLAWRLLKRKAILQRTLKGIGTRNVLIVGAGHVGQALADHLEQNRQLGFSFRGFLDANHSTHPKLLGKIDDLYRVARAEFIDDVLITIPSQREVVKSIAAQACLHRLNVKVVPDLYDGLGWEAPITHIGHFPVMELHWNSNAVFGPFLKRLIDIVGAVSGMILLSPMLVVTGAVVKLGSPGPVIYSSQRMGKKGRQFACYKFRTMVADADSLKHHFSHLNERKGPTFKITNDPRITGIGKFLRKYSLDELPQLWNVLKGDMSLVGPRPHPLDDCEKYTLDNLRRLDVKPGVTGLWQVTARQHPSFDTNMQLDLEYIDRWNLWLDARIVFKTLREVARGSGQ